MTSIMQLGINLEMAMSSIADGVRLVEKDGCMVFPSLDGKTGEYLADTNNICLETIPVEGKSTRLVLELTGGQSVDALKQLLAAKSAELLAFRG